MSRGVNKVILIGNLGRDAELHHFSNGGAIANLSVATTSSIKDKTSGSYIDKTEWHKVVIYGQLAIHLQPYLLKGSKVYIEGALRTRKWMDAKQVNHYTTEVIASKLDLLGNQDKASPREAPDTYIDNSTDFPGLDDCPF